jgi:hypothetical protein
MCRNVMRMICSIDHGARPGNRIRDWYHYMEEPFIFAEIFRLPSW